MPFTSTLTRMTGAFAGMLADTKDHETDSYVNEEASAEMRFGIMVKEGVGTPKAYTRGALYLTAGTDVNKLAGIVRHSHSYNLDNELGTIGLKPKATLGVLKRGKIYVEVDEAVTPTSPVRVRCTTNAGAVGAANGPGTFRTTASATHTILCDKFAKFAGITTGAGVVELSINMTGSGSATAD